MSVATICQRSAITVRMGQSVAGHYRRNKYSLSKPKLSGRVDEVYDQLKSLGLCACKGSNSNSLLMFFFISMPIVQNNILVCYAKFLFHIIMPHHVSNKIPGNNRQSAELDNSSLLFARLEC